MLYYMVSKKHLPGRIVPLGVPFPGRHALKCMSALREKSRKSIWGQINKQEKSSFSSPTEYSLKNASFRLHPVWGTHSDDPAVTIAEVLPLCPSQTNGNVGHKHRSQAAQLGQNLSHIDAYNGEEKVHMEKLICEELDARGIIIKCFCPRSPQI